MNYYHDLVTEKSWAELKSLRTKLEFVLIGGWATYLYTKGMKSKDIDIVIEFDQLEKLREGYELLKNERLKKYEAIKGEVQIDIYLPYYSEIGLELGQVAKRAVVRDGFRVVGIDDLVVLKLVALGDRGRSAKGVKDFLDIVSLHLTGGVEWGKVGNRLRENKLEKGREILIEMLRERTKLEELELNTHKYAKVRKELEKELG